MQTRYVPGIALAAFLVFSGDAEGGQKDGYRWLGETREILREGIVWNDRIGDGKDRYKSGGITQSWLIPESRLSDGRWFHGHASALELQARAFVATPDNVSAGAAPSDRPFAQYASVGVYLRTFRAPVTEGPGLSRMTEDRVGIELGYQGDPLPLFDIQELVHSDGVFRTDPTREIDSEVLVNLEGRRTWRWHQELAATDVEVAPYLMGSAGMRENSLRVGFDIIYGSSLEGRTWNIDGATGTLIPGGAQPRPGPQWLIWAGGDAGAVATDAFLDGGFSGDGYSVPREEFVGRARIGFMWEYDPFAIAYSLTWMSEEFEAQSHSQVIGAISVKYRF